MERSEIPESSPSGPAVVRVLEDALLADPGSMADGVVLAELSAWDSMAVVAFVGEVQDRWSVTLSVDEVSACATVADLVACVRARAGAA